MIVEKEKDYSSDELEWWDGQDEQNEQCDDEFCWKHYRPCNGKVENCCY